VSVNKVILLGNLGVDPDFRVTPNDVEVCTFSLATTESFGSGDDRTEETEWHNIVAWRGLARSCKAILRKGSKVYVEGRKKTRKWQDNDGNDHYTVEIIISVMEPCTPKPKNEESEDNE